MPHAHSGFATRPAARPSLLVLVSLAGVLTAALYAGRVHAQAPQQDEATRILQEYVRFDTSNPPGNTVKTADFLAAILQKEDIAVTRYESEPGKAILLARLKATINPPAGKAIVLLHHMDVVPADKSQWKVDPFAATITDGNLWGRGAMDMKGIGVAHLLAFVNLKRQHVPLNRDVIMLVVPDEEVGGLMGARWMLDKHYSELDPEYVLDEGGFGSNDLFAPGKLVYGISVAEKKVVWLKVRAEGVAGHASQPHDQNPNDRLVRALAHLLSQPMPTNEFSVLQIMKTRIGPFAQNKFMNAIQHSTIALTWIRSGVGDPPKTNVIPSVADVAFDCRVLPGTTKDQWVAEIKRRLGDPALKVEVMYESDDAIVTTQDTPLYHNLESAVKRRHPDAIVTPMLIPYGTDSNAFRPKGVKSYGFFPAVLPADVVSSMHGDAEHIPLAAVTEASQVFFEALRDTVKPQTSTR